MMLLRETSFDITEPNAWQEKINALRNLLEKFETVNENQSRVVDMLFGKTYDSTNSLRVEAQYRQEAVTLLKNICELLC